MPKIVYSSKRLYKQINMPILTCGLYAIGLSLTLSACTVGPDYREPETTLPQQWMSASEQPNVSDETAIEQTWWENFHDPVLNQLIATAINSNLDVKLAGMRIAEARALRASAEAALFPTGDMLFNASRQRNQIGFPSSAPTAITSAVKNPFNIFKTGFDASWELDLFGGHRRNAEAARAELEASALSRADILTSSLAEVARTYIDIRQYQAQLQIAEETNHANLKITEINNQAYAFGKTAGIDTSRAESQQQHDQTQLPYYRNLLAQAEYSMDVLLGEQPGMTHGLVNTASAIPSSDKKLVLAAPAVVIAQRPDIRYVERKLASATAKQGVALAKFFPDISLVGFMGLFNTNAGNLMNISSKSWSMGGNVLWPILSFGTLSANLDAADAKQQEALTLYQKTIISALADVERSVTAYTEQEKYTTSLQKSTVNSQNVYEIMLGRYQTGLSSLLEVLDAQRKYLTSQSQLTLAQAQTAQTLIAVYKSLGGGWKADEEMGKAAENR